MKSLVWIVGYTAGAGMLLAGAVAYGPVGYLAAACFIGAVVEVLDGTFND